MKKTVFIITFIILLCLTTVVNADTSGSIQLVVEHNNGVQVGDDVTVTFKPSVGLGALDLLINYSSDKLEFTGTSDYYRDMIKGEDGVIKICTYSTSGITSIPLYFKAIKEGTATLTTDVENDFCSFYVDEGNKFFTGNTSTNIIITTKSQDVGVTSITLDRSSGTLEIGDTVKLNAIVSPENATDKTVTWTSSNTSIATVLNGTVTAIKEGNVTITAKAGSKTATYTLTVDSNTDFGSVEEPKDEVIDVKSITLDKTSGTMKIGDTVKLNATVSPENATYKTITWTSSDTSIATVSNGTVTAIKEGNVTITATAGKQKATYTLIVKKEVENTEQEKIDVEEIKLDKVVASLKVGEKLNLKATIKPENATDKMVTWTSSDTSIATVSNGVVSGLKAGTVTITAKAGDKTVTARINVSAASTTTGDSTTAKTPIPQTGDTFTLVFAMVIMITVGSVAVIRYRKNRDI